MRNKTRKFWPRKYYSGLTRKEKSLRKKEIEKYGSKSWKDQKAYVGFKTDSGKKTKKSGYTKSWNKIFPDVKSLEDK